MKAGFVIVGAKELEANLLTLAKRVRRKVTGKAEAAGMRVLRDRARANARAIRRGGKMGYLLAKHIVVKVPKKQYPGTHAIHVQMRAGVQEFIHYAEGSRTLLNPGRGPGKEIGRSYIPAAIEFGHGATGEKAARPFLRPAADATHKEVFRILTKEMRAGILREAIKGRYE